MQCYSEERKGYNNDRGEKGGFGDFSGMSDQTNQDLEEEAAVFRDILEVSM